VAIITLLNGPLYHGWIHGYALAHILQKKSSVSLVGHLFIASNI